MNKWCNSIMLLSFLIAPAFADDKAPEGSAEMQGMMAAWEKASTPGAPHAQLAEHFAGTWTTKQSMWMDPAAEPSQDTGKAVSTAVFGGRQVRMDYEGNAMGETFSGVGYTGYDNVTGRYHSMWTDSMSTGMMLMYGDYDATTKIYTFRGEMADPMRAGAKTPLRNTISIIDADHHIFEMHETHDGKEAKTLMIEYTRVR